MAHSLLSQIHKDSNQWTVCVLVSRMWHYRGGTDEGPIKHTDLVLLDEEGNHMYGQIPTSSVDRFKDVLEEGEVFTVRKFMCNQSRPSFRPVESPFMVQFTRYTIVEERIGLAENYPLCTYNLTAYEDIPEYGKTTSRFIDVIGKIKYVSDIVPIQATYQTTSSNTRTVVMENLLGNELRLVLWGDRATEFNAEAVRAMGAKETVVAIFVGTLPKTHRGVRGLSGSSACRWYIDEDIPDINSFRESCAGKFVPFDSYTPTVLDAVVARVYEEPVEKTVTQLINSLDPFVDMEKRFICTVTIDRLGSDQRWWFASCSKCRKSSKYDGYQYNCTSEICSASKPILTYCISVFASDATGEAEFVFFDRVATGAVGRPLEALLRKRYPGQTTPESIAVAARHDTGVPMEISGLVGQKFKLCVCISKKWGSSNNIHSADDDLSFQFSRIEETYKSELPPLLFGAGAQNTEASSSAAALAMNLPQLGTIISPVPRTPPAPASVSRRNQTPSPVISPSPAAIITGSTAPRRGARRSLFMTPTKTAPQLNVEITPTPEGTSGTSVQENFDDELPTSGSKDDEVLHPKPKRNTSGSKSAALNKKPRQ